MRALAIVFGLVYLLFSCLPVTMLDEVRSAYMLLTIALTYADALLDAILMATRFMPLLNMFS